jgi:hypothetical protein
MSAGGSEPERRGNIIGWLVLRSGDKAQGFCCNIPPLQSQLRYSACQFSHRAANLHRYLLAGGNGKIIIGPIAGQYFLSLFYYLRVQEKGQL